MMMESALTTWIMRCMMTSIQVLGQVGNHWVRCYMAHFRADPIFFLHTLDCTATIEQCTLKRDVTRYCSFLVITTAVFLRTIIITSVSWDSVLDIAVIVNKKLAGFFEPLSPRSNQPPFIPRSCELIHTQEKED